VFFQVGYVDRNWYYNQERKIFICLGPYTIVDEGLNGSVNYVAKAMETTWNEDYHLMFVDQPIGVGWSPQGNETNVSSTAEAGDDFYKFITTFYSLKNFTMLH